MKLPKPCQAIFIDGSWYLFRAFHALPPLTNAQGHPTGAIYGVVSMLHKILSDLKPEYVAMVFDARGKNFRHELYADYKANRSPMPDDLKMQIEPLHRIIEAMGIPLIIKSGVEADDVIGTLAKQASARGLETCLSTGDKDFAQLVGPHVSLINTMTNQRMDREGVIEKFGVPPEHIAELLALMGDTSDNIPGVRGVGPKTAVKWLKQMGSLAHLMEHHEVISGKAGEALREALPDLPRSLTLTQIHCDVELDLDFDTLKPRAMDKVALAEWFQKFQFSSLLKRLEEVSVAPAFAPAAPVHYETILTEADFERWLQKIEKAPLISFDTETTSLNYTEAEIVGLAFAVEPNEAAYLPVAHAYEGVPPQLSRSMVLERLKPILEDPKRHKVGHHLKYDANVLANYDITLNGIQYDSMMESYLVESNIGRHDLGSAVKRYLNQDSISYEDVAGKGAKQISFDEVPIDVAARYSAEDADLSLKLHEMLWPKIESTGRLKNVYENIEIPLIPVLARMEQEGVLIDTKLLDAQSAELALKISDLEQQAYTLCGETFNLGSPKQLQEILFEKMGLPVLEKTPTGQASTGESALALLSEYELPRIILEYRGLSKLKNTYTDRLPEQVSRKTGRLHTSYHQAVTATGRLSSTDPNLQNIPIRTAEGRRIRQAFIAKPGFTLVSADYSQIELRIMAHLSHDPGLIAAFREGLDIHRATASDIFHKSLEDVTDDERRHAKAINFGLIYGMSAFGLSKQIGVSRSQADDYMKVYFKRFPNVHGYMESMRQKAEEQGFVETESGRRLYLPNIRSRNGALKKAAERAAINAPLQGFSADLIKLAMIHLDAWIIKEQFPMKMLLQVHDELVFEVENSVVEPAKAKIKALMEHVVELEVPLVVGVGQGRNWDEAH